VHHADLKLSEAVQKAVGSSISSPGLDMDSPDGRRNARPADAPAGQTVPSCMKSAAKSRDYTTSSVRYSK
jgi:hypothetical protein